MNHGNIHPSCEFFSPAARFRIGGVGKIIDGEGSGGGFGSADEKRSAGDARWMALSAGGRGGVGWGWGVLSEHVGSRRGGFGRSKGAAARAG